MAKRVNKRFLRILTVIVVIAVGLAGAALVITRMWGRNPKPFIEEGNRYVATYLQKYVPASLRGSWLFELPAASSQPINDETGQELAPEKLLEKAAIAYGRAAQYARRDPKIAVVIGDLRRLMTRYDPKMIGLDVGAWEAALEKDPSYGPAHERLLDAAIEGTEVSPSAGGFDRLGEKAKKFAERVDSANVRAQVYQDIGVIGAWLAGKATPESVIEERVDSLTKLQQKDSRLADIPRFIAKASLRLARDRMAAGDRVRAKALVERAINAFAMAPKESAENPRFGYQRYLTLSEIAEGYAELLVVSDPAKPTTQTTSSAQVAPTTEPEQVKIARELNQEGRKALQEAVNRIRKNAKSGQAYSRVDAEILTNWAMSVVQGEAGATEKGRAVFNELMAQRPFDQAVRLAAARLERIVGSPAKAEELLSESNEASPDMLGSRALLKPQLEIRRVMELADVRVEAYARLKAGSAANQETLKARRAQIEEGYKRAAGVLLEEDWRLLKLKGKMLLILDGDMKAIREAIPPLQKAYDKLESMRQMDYELAMLLEQAYLIAQQDGQAKAILSRVARGSGNASAIKSLVSLLFRDREYAQAKEYVATLEQQLPNDPEVMGYRLALIGVEEQQLELPAPAGVDPRAVEKAKADLSEKRKAILKKVQALPEDKPEQRLAKARLMIGGKSPESAEKILVLSSEEELKKADERDFSASGMLVSAYVMQKKQPAAQQLADRVLAKIPQSTEWKVTAAQLRGKLSDEEQRRFSEELIDQTKDEGEKAIRQYALVMQDDPKNADKNAEKGLALLQEAEKRVAQNGRILEAIWKHALGYEKWDLAEQYAQKLAEINWDQAQGLTYKARAKLARSDIEGALRDAVEVSRQVPYFASTWVLLGQAQAASQDFESAVASYIKAIERQPDNPQALQGLAQCYLSLGQVERAKEYIRRGMGLARQGEVFAEMAKQVDERSGSLEAVKAATAQRETELEKEQEKVGRWTAVAEDYVRLARMMQKTDAKGAEQYLQKASKLMDEAIGKFPDEPRPYQLLAEVSLLAGKPERGVELFNQLKARESWKSRPEPCVLLANYLERLGPDATGPAEQAWMEALSKSQNSLPVQQMMTAFYNRTGQFEKAANGLTRIAQETKDAGARRQLIGVQIRARKFAEAEKLLGEMLKENPSDVGLLSQRGYLKIQQGEFLAAEESLTQARKLDPDYLLARYYLGLMKMSRGDLSEAVVELQAACALKPADAELRMTLAEAYRRSNQLEEAAKELETALRSNPLRKDLRVSLVQCYLQDRRWIPAQRLLDEARATPELADDPIWSRIESSMWLTRGDLQQAYNTLLPATKLAPSDPAILKDLWDLLLKAQGWDEVIKYSDEKIQLLQAELKRRQDAGEKATLDLPWWIHMQRGMARKGQGKLDLAMQEFESGLSAVDRTEDDGAAEAIVAAMTETVGYEKTIQALSVRAKLRWKMALARAYAAQADWSKAIKTLDELLGQDDEKLSVGQRLMVLRTAGPAYHAASASVPSAAAKAEQAYSRCLKEMEDLRLDAAVQLDTLNNFALFLAERPGSPDPQEARVYSTKAYDIMRKANAFNAGVVDTHGWVLVLSGQVDLGIDLLRSAASKGNLDAWCHLGEAYVKKGDSKAAWGSFAEANNLMRKMKADKQPVDPTLEARIEAAMKKLAPTTQSVR